MLQRTQLMLDSPIKKQLEQVAVQKRISLSELVREILKKQLPKEEKKVKGGVDFLKKLNQTAVAGPGNADYDRYTF